MHSQELLYDVHFWIGEFSTQDEYCIAAYKTAELDTLVSHLLISVLHVYQYIQVYYAW